MAREVRRDRNDDYRVKPSQQAAHDADHKDEGDVADHLSEVFCLDNI